MSAELDRRLCCPGSLRSPRAALRPALAILALLLVAMAPGCLRLIAPYDEQTQQAIFVAARAVDQFYGDLLEVEPGKRPYAKFSERYVQIDTELRALVLRNEVRPLNEDSTSIARDILQIWEEKKDQHKKSDGYPDGAAKLDRGRLARMFRYAATAERAKPDDGQAAPGAGGGDGSGDDAAK